MKHCIIDIGTNTVKMSLYEAFDGGFETVLHKSMRCSLGLCLTDGKLNDEGIHRLCNAVEEYTALAHGNGCESVYAIATQSLRNCSNAKEVCETVKRAYNVDIDVISGEEEAFYSYSSLLLANPEAKNGISVDLGGGSCELVRFDTEGVNKSESFPFGVLSLTALTETCANSFTSSTVQARSPFPKGEGYTMGVQARSPFPKGEGYTMGVQARSTFPKGEGLNKAGKTSAKPTDYEAFSIPNEQYEVQIKQYVNETVNGFFAKELFAIGGTARGIFKLYSILHEKTHSLSLDELKELYNEIKTLDDCEELLKKELPQRYDSVLTGFCVFIALMESCGCERITLCTAGVREGYLTKKVLER